MPYSPSLRADLVAALPPARPGFEQVCALDVRIGQEFAAAAAAVGEEFDLVCSHGQTVFHWVEGGQVRGTLQLGQPAWIAEATGRPVVSDLRTADVAAGGQGAPLVPLLDALLLAPFVDEGLTAAALNLGGIANVTVCAPGEPVRAWDTGPANALVDAAAGGIDRDGRLAAAGTVDEGLLAALLAEPFYARTPPKTTGKELFHPGYVGGSCGDGRSRAPTSSRRSPNSPCGPWRTPSREWTSWSSPGAASATPSCSRGCGGNCAPGWCCPTTSAARGGEGGVAFALLGYAFATGRPGNVPSCTGARGERVLGQVTPGRSGLPATTRCERWPAALHLS